jgi:hypothetical protein
VGARYFAAADPTSGAGGIFSERGIDPNVPVLLTPGQYLVTSMVLHPATSVYTYWATAIPGVAHAGTVQRIAQ